MASFKHNLRKRTKYRMKYLAIQEVMRVEMGKVFAQLDRQLGKIRTSEHTLFGCDCGEFHQCGRENEYEAEE